MYSKTDLDIAGGCDDLPLAGSRVFAVFSTPPRDLWLKTPPDGYFVLDALATNALADLPIAGFCVLLVWYSTFGLRLVRCESSRQHSSRFLPWNNGASGTV